MKFAHYASFESRYTVDRPSVGILISLMEQDVDHEACKDCGKAFRGSRIAKRCPACRPAAAVRANRKAQLKKKARLERERQQRKVA